MKLVSNAGVLKQEGKCYTQYVYTEIFSVSYEKVF